VEEGEDHAPTRGAQPHHDAPASRLDVGSQGGSRHYGADTSDQRSEGPEGQGPGRAPVLLMSARGERSDRPRTVAIVGATGAVGEVLLDVLVEREFPVGELRALASERSSGKTVTFAGRDVPVETARAEALDGADFVFFAATGSLSKELAPEAVKRKAVAI